MRRFDRSPGPSKSGFAYLRRNGTYPTVGHLVARPSAVQHPASGWTRAIQRVFKAAFTDGDAGRKHFRSPPKLKYLLLLFVGSHLCARARACMCVYASIREHRFCCESEAEKPVFPGFVQAWSFGFLLMISPPGKWQYRIRYTRRGKRGRGVKRALRLAVSPRDAEEETRALARKLHCSFDLA